MKLHHFLVLVGGSLALPTVAPAANYEWTFNGGNLDDFFNNGTLAPVGSTTASFALTDGAGVPHIGGQQARYLNVPVSATQADGFALSFNASAANGGGAYLNDYTFVFDLYSPGAANWAALFNADPNNANDADLYLSPTGAFGIGAIGYTPNNSIVQDKWHRVTFATSLGSETKLYIDGTLLFTRTANLGVDGRFSLYSGTDAGVDVRLFNEGDTSGNYTHALYVNSVAFVDRKLTDSEVSALGAPNATGILVPEPAAAALLLPVLAGFAARRRRR